MSAMEYNPETRTHVRRFEGRLDSAISQELAGEMESEITGILAENTDAKLAFDLANVDFIVSAFLRVCLNAAKRMPVGKFSIINCRPEVKKIFAIAGFDKVIDVF